MTRKAFLTAIMALLLVSCGSQRVIPSESNQLVLLVTDSLEATVGNLRYFERSGGKQWTLAGQAPVGIGRNGMGWGRGAINPENTYGIPYKAEGDGLSPAGIFRLGAVFGYQAAEKMGGLKMPYIHLSDMVECVDDADSEFYNQVLARDEVEADWNSSEKMSRAGIYYQLGVLVEHNSDETEAGAGSCIFLHNWAFPAETSAGCTAMEPEQMKSLAYWLEKAKNPVIVQLPREIYLKVMNSWLLPEV